MSVISEVWIWQDCELYCSMCIFQVFKLHRLDNGPSQSVTVTRKEALKYYRDMCTIRHIESESKKLYHLRKIRGFLHLCSGQVSKLLFDRYVYDPQHVPCFRNHHDFYPVTRGNFCISNRNNIWYNNICMKLFLDKIQKRFGLSDTILDIKYNFWYQFWRICSILHLLGGRTVCVYLFWHAKNQSYGYKLMLNYRPLLECNLTWINFLYLSILKHLNKHYATIF